MKKKDLQINDKVDDTMSGGGQPVEKEEKKLGFWQRVWSWIKKLLGF